MGARRSTPTTSRPAPDYLVEAIEAAGGHRLREIEPHRNSRPAPTPSTRSSAARSIPGTRGSPPPGPPAAPRSRWRQAWPTSRKVPTTPARSAIPPPSAASSACVRAPALSRRGRAPCPIRCCRSSGRSRAPSPDTGLALDGMSRFEFRAPPLSRPRPAVSFHDSARRPARPRRAAFSMDLGRRAGQCAGAKDLCARRSTGWQMPGSKSPKRVPDLSACHAAFRPLRAFQFAALRHENASRSSRQAEAGGGLEHRRRPEAHRVGTCRRRSGRRVGAPEPRRIPRPLRRADHADRAGRALSGREAFRRRDRWRESSRPISTGLVLGYAVTVTGLPGDLHPLRPQRPRPAGRAADHRQALWRGALLLALLPGARQRSAPR